MHAALRLLAQMEAGLLISAICNNPDVKVLAAVQPDAHIQATLTNHSERPRDVSLRLPERKFAGREATVSIQRVDAEHSADGSGLEKPIAQRTRINSRGEFLQLRMAPWSVVGIDLQVQ